MNRFAALGLSLALGAATAAAAPAPQLPVVAATSELRDTVDRYALDRNALFRRFAVEASPERRRAQADLDAAWEARLRGLDFEKLSPEGRVDWLLLVNRLRHERVLRDREEKGAAETGPLLPFAGTVTGLIESRRRMEAIDPKAAATTLNTLSATIEKTKKAVEAAAAAAKAAKEGKDTKPDPLRPSRTVAWRASEHLKGLRETLSQWQKFYEGYDPLFTWWTAQPFKKADEALKAYGKTLRETVLGVKEGDDDPIVGDPIGREGLLADLAAEVIPYGPEDLVAVAEREFAWCEAEMKKASRDMGLGDDWKAALEKVKNLYVDPGRQVDLVRDMTREAVEFVEKKDLVTIPPLAVEIWRIEMLSPERQKVSPFFLGGEVLQVSYPTDAMPHEDKLMTLRGNNIHFSRATVFHEMFPGHNLQQFMNARHNPHRRLFGTPFWTEGWALWWEMLLWDQGFPRSPEDRVGMLFWRMHRCARILFSLNFHLGAWTPQQCIDFLVDRVGHERANATAEVRRSFAGGYGPLYQLAYMMGGLQFRALHAEIVDGKKMTDRAFHDAILEEGPMPVEMVRALLTKQTLTKDHKATWRYAGELRPAAH